MNVYFWPDGDKGQETFLITIKVPHDDVQTSDALTRYTSAGKAAKHVVAEAIRDIRAKRR